MIFTAYQDEQQNINELHKYNASNYVIIRLTDVMIKKNIIDANALFRQLLEECQVVDYKQLNSGGENGLLREALIYSGDRFYQTKMKLYKVRNERHDPRFSIYKIGHFNDIGVVRTTDLLYITVKDDQIVIFNITQSLPNHQTLKRIFGTNPEVEALAELTPLIKMIAKKGPHKNSKGAGKVCPKDAGDTLEALLGIKTNNRNNADYKGLIELKTKTAKNLDTLFTKRPRFDDMPISKIELKDKSRVSAFTDYYGYVSDKHPDAKSLYVTIGIKEDQKNGYGFYLNVNDEKSKVELWANNPVSGVSELSAYWTFNDLKEELEKKHPATVWLDVRTNMGQDGVAEFTYTSAVVTLSAQFSTFISMVKQGDITYDWRGYTSKNGEKYSGKNHGNAWRIKADKRNDLFTSFTTIDLDK